MVCPLENTPDAAIFGDCTGTDTGAGAGAGCSCGLKRTGDRGRNSPVVQSMVRPRATPGLDDDLRGRGGEKSARSSFTGVVGAGSWDLGGWDSRV